MRPHIRLIGPFFIFASFGVAAFGQGDEPKQPDAKAEEPAIPPSTDILDTLARTEKYRLFLQAVAAAGIEGELRKVEPMTLFAPTDEAFRKLPVGTLDELLADKARITAILHGHIVPGRRSAEQLAEAKMAKTLSQTTLTITPATQDMPLKVENANIVTADIATTNGVVHAIDVVLMPK